MPALQGFIPPYILDRIIRNGSQHQRQCALGTLAHVQQLLPNPGPPRQRLGNTLLAERGRPGHPCAASMTPSG